MVDRTYEMLWPRWIERPVAVDCTLDGVPGDTTRPSESKTVRVLAAWLLRLVGSAVAGATVEFWSCQFVLVAELACAICTVS